MNDASDIPEDIIERVEMMEGILISRATGGDANKLTYIALRKDFIEDPNIKNLLPKFVRTCRDLDAFWQFIQDEGGQEPGKYARRRTIVKNAFTSLLDHLEGRNSAPDDHASSEVLQSFDADGVHVIWAKALERRATDPEGAITVARTLLETVIKRILDECGETYTDKDNLPKLYNRAADELKLAPNKQTKNSIKEILGGVVTVVNGLGTLRNKLSDAHGRGGKLPVRPSARHASLAVNTAGAIATFLVETFNERQQRK